MRFVLQCVCLTAILLVFLRSTVHGTGIAVSADGRTRKQQRRREKQQRRQRQQKRKRRKQQQQQHQQQLQHRRQDLELNELQLILKSAGRNIALADRILQDFDTDHSGGLSKTEYAIFLKGRKNPHQYQRKPQTNGATSSLSSSHTSGSQDQDIQDQFQAAQMKMQQSFAALGRGNRMSFVSLAVAAISEAQAAIDSFLQTDSQKRRKKKRGKQQHQNKNSVDISKQGKIWKPWVVHMFATAGKYLHAVADQTSNREFLRQGLVIQYRLLRNTKDGSDEHLNALVETSQMEVETANFCKGVMLLEKFRLMRHSHGDSGSGSISSSSSSSSSSTTDSYKSTLAVLPERSMQQYTLASHNCDLQLSLKLFGHLMSMGYLDPKKPQVCTKCWGIYGVVLRKFDRNDEFINYFEKHIRPGVPWVHAHQLPSTFNQLLATEHPETLWISSSDEKYLHREVPAPTTMSLLHEHRDTIMHEYFQYEKTGAQKYDGNHEDSWMTRNKDANSSGNGDNSSGGYWEYLRLRSAGGIWDEKLCRNHFPKTCALFKASSEINGPYPSTAKCIGYCPKDDIPGEKRSTGMISFYRLGADKSVQEHSGGDNQRLKCHLVLRAPPKSEDNPAYIQVSDNRMHYGTGDTFCFDDSFYHSVHNGGGVYKNISRVVLDVAVWHPNLFSM